MAVTNYPSLAIEDLIGTICRFYPDHILEKVWDFQKHQLFPVETIKDSLALYVVRQVFGVYKVQTHPVQVILNLRGEYERAIDDLHKLTDGLTELANTWLVLDFCHFLMRQLPTRKNFTVELFNSWLSVHDVEVFRRGSDALYGKLNQSFPTLGGAQVVELDQNLLEQIIGRLRSQLQRCPEVPPAEPVLEKVEIQASEGATVAATIADGAVTEITATNPGPA